MTAAVESEAAKFSMLWFSRSWAAAVVVLPDDIVCGYSMFEREVWTEREKGIAGVKGVSNE